MFWKRNGVHWSHLAAHEAVEVIEPHADGPLRERPGRAVLVIRRVVVLAEPRGRVAVLLQDFADGAVVDADVAIVAGEAGRLFGDDAEADGVVVAAGDDRGPRRRAERGRMELGVLQPHLRDAVHRRRRDDAAEGARHAVARVVGHDEQHVGRTLGRHDVRRPVRLGVLGAEADGAAELRGRVRQVVAVRGLRVARIAGLRAGVGFLHCFGLAREREVFPGRRRVA